MHERDAHAGTGNKIKSLLGLIKKRNFSSEIHERDARACTGYKKYTKSL